MHGEEAVRGQTWEGPTVAEMGVAAEPWLGVALAVAEAAAMAAALPGGLREDDAWSRGPQRRLDEAVAERRAHGVEVPT